MSECEWSSDVVSSDECGKGGRVELPGPPQVPSHSHCSALAYDWPRGLRVVSQSSPWRRYPRRERGKKKKINFGRSRELFCSSCFLQASRVDDRGAREVTDSIRRRERGRARVREGERKSWAWGAPKTCLGSHLSTAGLNRFICYSRSEERRAGKEG